jgi:hypothetical protein
MTENEEVLWLTRDFNEKDWRARRTPFTAEEREATARRDATRPYKSIGHPPERGRRHMPGRSTCRLCGLIFGL